VPIPSFRSRLDHMRIVNTFYGEPLACTFTSNIYVYVPPLILTGVDLVLVFELRATRTDLNEMGAGKKGDK